MILAQPLKLWTIKYFLTDWKSGWDYLTQSAVGSDHILRADTMLLPLVAINLSHNMACGVPQGSILRTLLFSVYMVYLLCIRSYMTMPLLITAMLTTLSLFNQVGCSQSNNSCM